MQHVTKGQDYAIVIYKNKKNKKKQKDRATSAVLGHPVGRGTARGMKAWWDCASTLISPI